MRTTSRFRATRVLTTSAVAALALTVTATSASLAVPRLGGDLAAQQGLLVAAGILALGAAVLGVLAGIARTLSATTKESRRAVTVELAGALAAPLRTLTLITAACVALAATVAAARIVSGTADLNALTTGLDIVLATAAVCAGLWAVAARVGRGHTGT